MGGRDLGTKEGTERGTRSWGWSRLSAPVASAERRVGTTEQDTAAPTRTVRPLLSQHAPATPKGRRGRWPYVKLRGRPRARCQVEQFGRSSAFQSICWNTFLRSTKLRAAGSVVAKVARCWAETGDGDGNGTGMGVRHHNTVGVCQQHGLYIQQQTEHFLEKNWVNQNTSVLNF